MKHTFKLGNTNKNISKSKALKLLRTNNYVITNNEFIFSQEVDEDQSLIINFLCRNGILKEDRTKRVQKAGILQDSLTLRKLKLKEDILNYAFAIAQDYHNNVKSLYSSSRATINIGYGASQEKNYTIYAKSYKYPAKWSNAGVYVKDKMIYIENSRGTIVFKMAVPTATERKLYMSNT